MKIINFLKDGEKYINGEEMLKRCGNDMADQEDLEYYLAHQDEIPKEYRDNYLIFGNYTKLYSHVDRRVAYLDWGGDSWILRWDWLGNVFRGDDLVVRARKSLEPQILGSKDILEFLDTLELGIKKLREKL